VAFLPPDVLVLAGGGIVGEAWMSGVLAGIEDAAGVDLRRTEGFVGTSAGSIVAASLAAGRSPRRPEEGPRRPGRAAGQDSGGGPAPAAAAPAARLPALARAAGRAAWALTAPLSPAALSVGAPAGALARAGLLARAPDRGRSLRGLRSEVQRSGATFDGRLRVVAVDKASGRRVVFGSPGAPRASVAEAVEASCSIPWVFAPVEIGGRRYVDGGAWSVTNLDVAAVGPETRVLCLEPTAAAGAGSGEPPSAFGPLRHALRAAAAVEEAALRRRGATVQRVGPDAAASRAMGPNLMAGGRAAAALSAGFAQGRLIGAEA
jgi:NTE family protein